MVERAMILPPMAPWMAILNCCRGISSLSRSQIRTAQSRARSLMDDHGQGVHFLAVHQDIQLDQVAVPVVDEFVVEGAVALGDGFQLVVKIDR